MRVTAMVIITETVGETGAENSLEHSLTVQPLWNSRVPISENPCCNTRGGTAPLEGADTWEAHLSSTPTTVDVLEGSPTW